MSFRGFDGEEVDGLLEVLSCDNILYLIFSLYFTFCSVHMHCEINCARSWVL